MLRLATIGTSWITTHFAESAALVPEVTLACAYSRDAERAAAFAKTIGATSSASDLDAMLASDDIDAVYVASPNAVHAHQVRAAIHARKHVLVEKPATPNEAEWQSLVDDAREAGVVLIEGMLSEYDPGTAAIRDLLGRLGPLRRASLRYHKRSARYSLVQAGQKTNIFDPEMGGGALNDLGVYVVHMLVTLFGEPRTIHASSVTIPGGADGAGAAIAGYDGFVADLSYSKITASSAPSTIEGELGSLVIDNLQSARHIRHEPIGGEPIEHVVPGQADLLDGEIRRFAHLVATGGDATPDQELTRITLRTMDRIRESW